MGLLDKYQNLLNEESDNKFPEGIEQTYGLTEDDREMYEKVLNDMRAEMEKANEDMRKKSSSWGDVCQEVNGEIQNKTYNINDEIRAKMNENVVRSQTVQSPDAKMHPVSEPFGFFVEGFRCPKCGRLMYQDGGKFVCKNCGYSEESDACMQFYFVDNTYTKVPLPALYNNKMCEAFAKGQFN